MRKPLHFIFVMLITGIVQVGFIDHAFGVDYYPETYGARTDDVSYAGTNVTAINAALYAARNSGGRVVLNGLYYVNGQINGQSNQTLTVGESGGIIKAIPNMPVPSDGYLLRASGKTGFIIDGVEFDGNRMNQIQDAAHTFGGVLIVDSNQCTVTNSLVHDFNGQLTSAAAGNGLRTLRSDNILFSNNQIHSNNGCGINIFNSSSYVRAINNTIWNNTEIGIESEGRSGDDYVHYRNSHITISGNTIEGQTDPGRLSDHGILVDWTDNVVIDSNQCINNNHNGIEVLGCTYATVSSNTLSNNGDVGLPYVWAGVRVTAEGFGEDGRSYETTIFDNEITGSQFGVSVNTATRTTMYGNTMSSIPNASLKIYAMDDNAVSITGLNVYSGETIVESGMLLVDNASGSATGSSSVMIASGARLGGLGIIGGSVTIANQAAIAPGISTTAGTLNINGDLHLDSGSRLEFDLGDIHSSDKVSMASSTLFLSGQQFDDFAFIALPGFGAGSYVLIDADAISGSLGPNVEGTIGTMPYRLAVLGDDLMLLSVPEPHMCIHIIIGSLVLFSMAIAGRTKSRNHASIQVQVVDLS